MKKNISKLISMLTLAAILPMASGFCFMAVFASPLVQVRTASAAVIGQTAMEDDGACTRSQADQPQADPAPEMPLPSHDKSLLPCCFDGSHSGILAISQSLDISKAFASAIIIGDKPLIISPELAAYYNPIAPPANLHIVRTTILRL